MHVSKIVFVNRFFYPDESATSQILTDLATALVARGEKVHVIASALAIKGGGASSLSEHRGVSIHRVRTTSFGNGTLVGRLLDYVSFYPGAFVQLMRVCAKGDRVVVKTDPPLISVTVAIAARLKGASLINWLQDLYPEVGAELGISVLRGPVGTMLARIRDRVLRRAALNVVIGERMRDRLRAVGVPESRIAVIPNWSDEELIKPLPVKASQTRKAWQLPDEAFVVGYSGNLGRAHESDTLLGAARRLRQRSDVIFLFVGGGREYERLSSIVEEEKLMNILFRDHQPREQLSDSLAAADVHWLSLRPELEGLIVPSKFYGIAAAGRPAIAVTSPTGEIATIVRDADCGDVVAPGDVDGLVAVIERMADNRSEATEKGQRARAVLEKDFTRGAALKRWHDVLAGVSSNSGADVRA